MLSRVGFFFPKILLNYGINGLKIHAVYWVNVSGFSHLEVEKKKAPEVFCQCKINFAFVLN